MVGGARPAQRWTKAREDRHYAGINVSGGVPTGTMHLVFRQILFALKQSDVKTRCCLYALVENDDRATII
jgi:hypothetical protein